MNSNMEKPYVVGIDIGGTNTVFGIVDARGTIIASSSIKTGAYEDVNDYVDEVCKNLLPLIIANGGVDKIKGIGDRKSTRLNSSHASKSRMPSSA